MTLTSITPATPVSFGGCAGLLHLGYGRTGVLVCAPWGYEELCLHKSLRQWCDSLASQGAPCLRFDYPCSGASAGEWEDARLEDWLGATRAGANVLRSIGVSDIVLVGFGIGGLVALSLCRQGFEIKGLALVGAPESGSRHLRQMALWNAMILREINLEAHDDSLNGQGPESKAGACIAGFLASPALTQAVKSFDLKTFDKPPTENAVVALRGDVEDENLARQLESLGTKVQRVSFPGYADLVNSPTMQQTPIQSFSALARAIEPWLDRRPRNQGGAERIAIGNPAVLEGEGWREQAVRFGVSNRLYGILCWPHPSREITAPSKTAEQTFPGKQPGVVLLSSGRNPLTGWRRSQTDLARDLARSDIVTLRFDLSDIGDSSPASDQPEEILYSDWAIADVQAALSLLQKETNGPLGLYGSCSGAFLALRTALVDSRVRFLVQLNVIRLEWPPFQDVASAILYGNRRLGTVLSDKWAVRLKMALTQPELAVQKFQYLAAQIWDRVRVAFMRWPWPLNVRRSMYKRLMSNLSSLRARGVVHVIAYTGNDDGINDFRDYFGKLNGSVPGFENITTAFFEGADHDLTLQVGSAWRVNLILQAAHAARAVCERIESS